MHYLDHAATTPVSASVQQLIFDELQFFGNPSSTYQIGRVQKQKVQHAKQQILKELEAEKQDAIIFTGSGSEANNLVFETIIQHFEKTKGHIIVTAIEHPSVKKAAEDAKRCGFELTWIKPDESGVISVQQVEASLRPDTRLVSVMTVNNETGVRQPIHQLGELLADKECYFHTDAVQAFAQEKIDVTASHIDYLSASGHKINAPKGIGFLYKSAHAPIHSLIKGGGQEQGWRAGTENVPYMMGLALAMTQTAEQRDRRHDYYEILNHYLLEQLTTHQIEFAVNGTHHDKSGHVLNLWLKGIQASQALILCDLQQVAISAGSACSAGSLEPSPVLTAMFGEQNNRIRESVRLSFSLETTQEDIDAFVAVIASIKR